MSRYVKIDSLQAILAKRGLVSGGKVQQIVDSEVRRLSEPYMPRKEGYLIRSMTNSTVDGSGLVIVNTPYAERLYTHPEYNFQQGRTKDGKIDYERNSVDGRGGEWFDRMLRDHADDIGRTAAKAAGGHYEPD